MKFLDAKAQRHVYESESRLRRCPEVGILGLDTEPLDVTSSSVSSATFFLNSDHESRLHLGILSATSPAEAKEIAR